MSTTTWQYPEREIILRRMVEEKKSAGEIAHAMGLTRCQIIGKASRLHLKLQGSNARRVPRPPPVYAPIPLPPPRVIVLTPPKPAKPHIRLDDALPSHCRFPIGESRLRMICAETVIPNSSYCANHSRICYQHRE